MAAAGATVVPSARTAAEVEAVADEARDFGVEARGITADVTDDDDVEALVEEIVDAFGSPWIFWSTTPDSTPATRSATQRKSRATPSIRSWT